MSVSVQHEVDRGFAIRFVRMKVRQLIGRAGLTRSDRDDLEQELVLRLLQARERFDPEMAAWKAFVVTVVERRVATILESRRRFKRHAERITSLSTDAHDSDGEPCELGDTIGHDDQERLSGRAVRHHVDDVDLREDVAGVLDRLEPEHRELAAMLAECSKAEAQRRLGLSWRQLNRLTAEIRRAFLEADLGPLAA